jgi:hypothetical protein
MQRTCDMPCTPFWLSPRSDLERRLGGAGWGLFFLWVGLSLLLHVGWGAGLLGVGILTLTMQVVRRSFGLPVKVFWALIGSATAVAGVWKLVAIEAPLGSLLLMVFGTTLLALSLRRRIGR